MLHVPTRILESIATGCGDQGILLIVKRPDCDLARILSATPSLLLLAHGVQDPGNLGSMIRTAWGFGVEGVILLEGCADPFAGRAARAAMGALFHTSVATVATLPALDALGRADLHLIASDPAGVDWPTAVDMKRPTVLCVGSEGSGLPERILRAAERRVRIPMAPGVSSLNVHAAAVALLYESARQRGFGHSR